MQLLFATKTRRHKRSGKTSRRTVVNRRCKQVANCIFTKEKKCVMYHDLSKKEKKIARACIDKGVDAEFKGGLEKAKKVITEWEKGGVDNRSAYHKLFKTITSHDKRIQKRYDGLTGSRYLVTVALILFDCQITEDDIRELSEEAKQLINNWISLWKEE